LEKRGVNIKLAQELTGYKLDVFRDDLENSEEFDIDLHEFEDDIDKWVIDSLISIGCDTARSVLVLSNEDLVDRADLEVETVLEVKRILNAEFED
jgi:N utilization substance protein A